jgi:hypothetical protein
MVINFIIAFGMYGICGYEIGDEMEHGHGQGWFKAKCPSDEAGEKLMNKQYREFMGVRPRMGHKITLKIFQASQTEQFMTGYCIKQWGAGHFFYEAHGVHFTNDYLNECRESYTIRATNYEKGKQVIEKATMLKQAYAYRTREVKDRPELQHWNLVQMLVDMINSKAYVIGSKYHTGQPMDLKASSITFKVICQQADNEVVHVFDVVNAIFGANKPATMTFAECEEMCGIYTGNSKSPSRSPSVVHSPVRHVTPPPQDERAPSPSLPPLHPLARQLFGPDTPDDGLTDY